MTLAERLSRFKTAERYTYRELSNLIVESFSFTYEFTTGKIKRVTPSQALKIDSFLKDRGY